MLESTYMNTTLPKNTILSKSFSTDQQLLFERHLSLVIEANRKVNLTRISSVEEGRLLHIEDSLVAYPEIANAPEGDYADLGTGAGFPGIPISIVTKRHTTLVDSVQKKVAVLDNIVNSLGLSNQIDTFAGRIEDLSTQAPEKYTVISARALSTLPSLLELSVPLLQENGHLVCYKAQIEENEIETAALLEEKLRMKLISDRKVLLSDGNTQRRILVFEKTGQPLVKLPRKLGMAQKRPFSS